MFLHHRFIVPEVPCSPADVLAQSRPYTAIGGLVMSQRTASMVRALGPDAVFGSAIRSDKRSQRRRRQSLRIHRPSTF